MLTIYILVSLGIGIAGGYGLRRYLAVQQANTLEARAEKTLADAKDQAKEVILSAKDKAVKVLDEARKDEEGRRTELKRVERRLESKEADLERKIRNLEDKERDLETKKQDAEDLMEQVRTIKQKKEEELAHVANLTPQEAREELLKKVEKDASDALFSRIVKVSRDGADELQKKVEELIVTAMERYSASHAAELTTSSVALPNEEVKGRIIGKEGRNIRAFEKATGVELIIDDTPELVVISAFDPMRRQIAKTALEKLIKDGRIQPARIEEVVEKAEEEINEQMKTVGENAVFDVGVVGLDPRLIALVGRLQFRTSFGQNVLMHSVEAAHIAGIIAAELGTDIMVAKKAALLHDIGKALDHEIQGTHIDIGRRILEKFNVEEAVIDAVVAHHEEVEQKSLTGVIVKVAEAISAARPGARKDTVENYIHRLQDLEKIANNFDGVEKTYAIQAGREIRVFVNPEKITDVAMWNLAKDIAKNIEQELKYPGEIKVNVIRESRIVEYAR